MIASSDEAAAPELRVNTMALSRQDAIELLATHHVGLLAIAFHDRVTIELVSYVYSDGWVYGRLEDGPSLDDLRHHQWVALHVGEVSGIYDWRTVTLRGIVEFLTSGGEGRSSTGYAEALDLLRAAVPAIFTPRDPMPSRVQLLRVFADAVEGRAACSNGGSILPRP